MRGRALLGKKMFSAGLDLCSARLFVLVHQADCVVSVGYRSRAEIQISREMEADLLERDEFKSKFKSNIAQIKSK